MRVADCMQILIVHFRSRNTFLTPPESTIAVKSIMRVALRTGKSSDVDGVNVDKQCCLGFGKFDRLGEEIAALARTEVLPRQIVYGRWSSLPSSPSSSEFKYDLLVQPAGHAKDCAAEIFI